MQPTKKSLIFYVLTLFVYLAFIESQGLASQASPSETGDNTLSGDGPQPLNTDELEPFKISILELSAHGGDKSAVKVYWNIEDEDGGSHARLNNVSPAFSFQWVVPPVEAKGFVIVPISEEAPKLPVKWIPISVVDTGNSADKNLRLHESSLYFPIPVGPGRTRMLMDRDYVVETMSCEDPSLIPRALPSRPQVATGWTFIGIWNSETSRWRSLYWLETDGAASLKLRKFPTASLPSGLTNRKLVANFPMRMRKNASAESEEVQPNVKLRPGTVVTVNEIAVEGVTADFRVWARVSATGEQHIFQLNK